MKKMDWVIDSKCLDKNIRPGWRFKKYLVEQNVCAIHEIQWTSTEWGSTFSTLSWCDSAHKVTSFFSQREVSASCNTVEMLCTVSHCAFQQATRQNSLQIAKLAVTDHSKPQGDALAKSYISKRKNVVSMCTRKQSILSFMIWGVDVLNIERILINLRMYTKNRKFWSSYATERMDSQAILAK